MSLGFARRSNRQSRSRHYQEFTPRPRNAHLQSQNVIQPGSISGFMQRHSGNRSRKPRRDRQHPRYDQSADNNDDYEDARTSRRTQDRRYAGQQRGRSRTQSADEEELYDSLDEEVAVPRTRGRTNRSRTTTRSRSPPSRSPSPQRRQPPTRSKPSARRQTSARSKPSTRSKPSARRQPVTQRRASRHARNEEGDEGAVARRDARTLHEKDKIPTDRFQFAPKQRRQTSIDDNDENASQSSRIARTVKVAQSQRRGRLRRRYRNDDVEQREEAQHSQEEEEVEEEEIDTRQPYNIIFMKAFQRVQHQLTDTQMTELASLLMSFVQDEKEEDTSTSIEKAETGAAAPKSTTPPQLPSTHEAQQLKSDSVSEPQKKEAPKPSSAVSTRTRRRRVSSRAKVAKVSKENEEEEAMEVTSSKPAESKDTSASVGSENKERVS